MQKITIDSSVLDYQKLFKIETYSEKNYCDIDFLLPHILTRKSDLRERINNRILILQKDNSANQLISILKELAKSADNLNSSSTLVQDMIKSATSETFMDILSALVTENLIEDENLARQRFESLGFNNDPKVEEEYKALHKCIASQAAFAKGNLPAYITQLNAASNFMLAFLESQYPEFHQHMVSQSTEMFDFTGKEELYRHFEVYINCKSRSAAGYALLGKNNDASKHLVSCINHHVSVFGKKTLRPIALYSILADVETYFENHDLAVEALNKALEHSVEFYGSLDTISSVEILRKRAVAKAYSHAEKCMEEAEKDAETAKQILGSLPDTYPAQEVAVQATRAFLITMNGKKNEAIAFIESATQNCDNSSLILVNDMIADGYLFVNDLEKALEHATIALKTKLKLYGEKDFSLSSSYLKTSFILERLNRIEEALKDAEVAEDILKAFDKKANLTLVLARCSKGRNLLSKGQIIEGSQSFKSAKELIEDYPEKSFIYSLLNNNLAVCYAQAGNFKRSQNYFSIVSDILAELSNTLNKKHIGLASQNKAAAFFFSKKYNEALEQFELSSLYLEDAYGNDHLYFAEMKFGQAMTYSKLKNFDEASSSYQSAFEIKEKFLGPDSLELVSILLEYSILAIEHKKSDLSKGLLKQIVKIYVGKYGESSSEAQPWQNMLTELEKIAKSFSTRKAENLSKVVEMIPSPEPFPVVMRQFFDEVPEKVLEQCIQNIAINRAEFALSQIIDNKQFDASVLYLVREAISFFESDILEARKTLVQALKEHDGKYGKDNTGWVMINYAIGECQLRVGKIKQALKIYKLAYAKNIALAGSYDLLSLTLQFRIADCYAFMIKEGERDYLQLSKEFLESLRYVDIYGRYEKQLEEMLNVLLIKDRFGFRTAEYFKYKDLDTLEECLLMGEVKAQAGKGKEAIDQYESLLKKFTSNYDFKTLFWSLCRLGSLYLSMTEVPDFEKAAEKFDEAKKLVDTIEIETELKEMFHAVHEIVSFSS